MTDSAVLEWSWTLAHAVGVILLGRLLFVLYDYRRAAVLPGEGNGRRGLFAGILLRFGRVSFLMHVLMLLAGGTALIRPDPSALLTTSAAAVYISLAFDVAWFMTMRDFSRIQRYREREEDGGTE